MITMICVTIDTAKENLISIVTLLTHNQEAIATNCLTIGMLERYSTIFDDTPRYSTILGPQVESVAQPRKNRVSSGLGTRGKRSSLNETLVDEVIRSLNMSEL
jgi:hypothetical protein